MSSIGIRNMASAATVSTASAQAHRLYQHRCAKTQSGVTRLRLVAMHVVLCLMHALLAQKESVFKALGKKQVEISIPHHTAFGKCSGKTFVATHTATLEIPIPASTLFQRGYGLGGRRHMGQMATAGRQTRTRGALYV